MIFNNEFGSKVKELRKMRMLSQKDVAEYLNVTPTQISDIENGKTAPSFQRAIMLATLFEISLDYLAGISERGYRYYEMGTREPNLSTLVQMADILHVSLDELVGRSFSK